MSDEAAILPSAVAQNVVGTASVAVVDHPPLLHIDSADRLLPLDGWRGLSILFVLGCHMLPLGPKSWKMNDLAGLLGMSLFFTLSGFLITSMLLRRMDIRAFFIRRACRILPLVLLYMTVVLLFLREPVRMFLAHYFFVINYIDYWIPGQKIPGLTGPLWSVCVEIHFYLFIGLLCLTLRRAAFWLLPALCFAVTGMRVYDHLYGSHTYASIVTHLRVDEILAGACLALVYTRFIDLGLRRFLGMPLIQPILAVLLLLSCHEAGGALNYGRPYFAAALVGSTLLQKNLWQRFLMTRPLAYIAAISYALYVIHPVSMYGWLGSGSTWVKYAKRPLCFLIALALAHLSTFYYEKFWIARGKKWSSDRRREVATQPI